MQSNLGVVTKIGVWLMPEPEMYSPVDVGVEREEDIVALIDALRPLRLDGTIPAATIANWMRIVATQTTRAQWYDGKDAMPTSAIEKLKKTMRIPHWGLRFGLYGPTQVVEEKIQDRAEGVLLDPRRHLAWPSTTATRAARSSTRAGR